MKRYVLIKQCLMLIMMLSTSNVFAMRVLAGFFTPAFNRLAADATWDNIGKAVRYIAVDGPPAQAVQKGFGWVGKRIDDINTRSKVAADAATKEIDRIQQSNRLKRQSYEEIINNRHSTPEAIKGALGLLKVLDEDERKQILAANKTKEAWDNLAQSALGVPIEGAKFLAKMVDKAQDSETQKSIANITAYQQRVGHREAVIGQAREWGNFIKQNPHIIVGTAGGIFALWQGTKVAAKVIDEKISLPALADRDKSSLIGLHEKFYNWLIGTKPPSAKLSDAFFEPKLAQRISDITTSLKNTVANGGFLPNMLFYGPPGTGKTLVAMLMARSCGMQYICFSGSALAGYSTEEAIKRLTHLFRSAAGYKEKVMIIVDEADAILADRSRTVDDKKRTLVTHFLNYTGTENRDYCFVCITNRRQDLDEAVRSRCDYEIKIDVPAYEQVLDMVRYYVNKYLIEASDMQPPKASLYTRWFGTPLVLKKVTVADGVLTNEVIEEIARTFTDNSFVGRDISKVILAIRSTAMARDNVITADIVNLAIENKIAEKKADLDGAKYAIVTEVLRDAKSAAPAA